MTLCHCRCRALLIGESCDAAAQAAAERITTAAEELLQRTPAIEGTGAAQRLPAPVRELVRVTAAGAGHLLDSELEIAAQQICWAARRHSHGAAALVGLLRYGLSDAAIMRAEPTHGCRVDPTAQRDRPADETIWDDAFDF